MRVTAHCGKRSLDTICSQGRRGTGLRENVMFDFLLWRHIPDEVLIRFRAGLLDQESFRALEAHVLLCPTCQLQLEDLLPLAQRREPA